jgi:hypothetical protein
VRTAPIVVALIIGLALLPCTRGLAQDSCAEPQEPAPVDGAQASEDQMRAAADAARGFIAQSDVYQACLANQLNAAKAQATADGKPLDPTLEGQIKAKTDANQKLKEKVGLEINTAIGVYKQFHLK